MSPLASSLRFLERPPLCHAVLALAVTPKVLALGRQGQPALWFHQVGFLTPDPLIHQKSHRESYFQASPQQNLELGVKGGLNPHPRQCCPTLPTSPTSLGLSPTSLNLRGVLLRAYLQPLKYMLQEQPKEKEAPQVLGSLPWHAQVRLREGHRRGASAAGAVTAAPKTGGTPTSPSHPVFPNQTGGAARLTRRSSRSGGWWGCRIW